MSEEREPRIKVQDRRQAGRMAEAHRAYGEASAGAGREQLEADRAEARAGAPVDRVPEPDSADPSGAAGAPGGPAAEAAPDGELEGLRAEVERLRSENEQLRYHLAELQNKQKRMLRDQTAAIRLANKDLIARLLSVLDNFDRAIEHAEDASSLEIVRKDLMRVLAEEGLEEVPAEGRTPDYNVHEAIASHEEPGLDGERIVEVYQKGYKLKGDLLRPARVAVARPAEGGPQGDGRQEQPQEDERQPEGHRPAGEV